MIVFNNWFNRLGLGSLPKSLSKRCLFTLGQNQSEPIQVSEVVLHNIVGNFVDTIGLAYYNDDRLPFLSFYKYFRPKKDSNPQSCKCGHRSTTAPPLDHILVLTIFVQLLTYPNVRIN